MEITFFGANCVRLTGRDISLIANPISKSTGLADLKVSGDATLLGQAGMDLPAKAGVVIDGPGEYEVKGTQIIGVPARLHTEDPEAGKGVGATIYSVKVDGVRIGLISNIAAALSNEQVDALGTIDVLVIPIGNHGLTLGPEHAASIISQLEPKYVVPTHYDDGKTKYDVPQEKLDAFLKEVGSHPEPISKLKITEKDLPLETTVVVLERQGA